MGLQEKATRAVSRLMSLNLLMWLTTLVLFASLLLLAAAAFLAMVTVLAPALAALFTGLGLLVVFLLLALLVRVQLRPAPAKAAGAARAASEHDAASTETRDLAPSTSPIDQRATDWLRHHPDLAIGGALAIGIALTASPGLRRLTVRSLGPALGTRAIRTFMDHQTRTR